MFVGDDVDVNYQLGEGSVQSCINEDGSITSSKVDLTKNDITDDLLEVEAAHNNANSLKLDLDQLHDDGDGSSANSSKKSKRSGEKKTESKKSKRRDSLSKEYKIR